MRVFAGGISTETNTFSPMPTGLADFDVVRAADLDESGQMGGFGGPFNIFRRHCQERGWDYRFSLYASAQPAVAQRFREIPCQRADLRKYPWLDDPFAN